MRRARTAARAPATTPLANTSVLLVLVNTLAACIAFGAALTAETPVPDSLTALGAILPPFVNENFDELVRAASATCEALPQHLLFSRFMSVEPPQTQLVQITRKSRRSYRVQSAHQRLRMSRPLVLYVPGWWNTPNDASSQAIVTSLMTKHPSILLLDTRLSFCRGYISAVSNIIPLSNLLYGFIKNLHNTGYPVSSIHIIGFSLGAHVAGVTGKLVKQKLNTTLGQITALDPARPCFSHTEHRLDKSDAQFVQVIHASAGVLGLAEPLGHADVYVNGISGKHPECQHRSISLACDHAQAWKLFSASAINETTLTGRRCASWKELRATNCTGDETVLGYACSRNAHGLFLYESKKKKKKAEVQPLQLLSPLNILRWPLG